MASVSVKFKLPDGSTYSDSIGYSYFYGINPNVVVGEANALTKIIGTLDDQKKKLNSILAGTSRVGSISDDYLNYAYTDEFEDCIKERAEQLETIITKLKTMRDNLLILVNEYNTKLSSLSDYEKFYVSAYIVVGDRRNG